MTYHLQSRWVLEGKKLYYYGLRNSKNMFKNTVHLSNRQSSVISKLPCSLSDAEKKCLGSLLGVQVVTEDSLRRLPKSFREAVFCKNCCANDFMIPGLEFDESGLCPMCQTADCVKELKSIVPIVHHIPRCETSDFDIALFYTGGKDSSFLLYYLSKVLGLRVLALTWEIPFMSDSAKESIARAKAIFKDVRFISRALNDDDLRKIYKKLYSLSGNTCACPSLAYVLFYPDLVENNVPYFAAGNEPAQMLGLYYNHIAPPVAYKFTSSRFLTFLFNTSRVLTFRPPLKQGQFQTLMTMKQLAHGDSIVKKLTGYESELVTNITTAIHEVPQLLLPLKQSIRRSSRTGKVPAFVHFDFDEICGGSYDWDRVKNILINECGWVSPDDRNKALHTSCKIEKCKDNSQFRRFYYCQSKMIPFSALEFALAGKGSRSKESIMYEMEQLLGFSLDEVPECALMKEYLGDSV